MTLRIRHRDASSLILAEEKCCGTNSVPGNARPPDARYLNFYRRVSGGFIRKFGSDAQTREVSYEKIVTSGDAARAGARECPNELSGPMLALSRSTRICWQPIWRLFATLAPFC